MQAFILFFELSELILIIIVVGLLAEELGSSLLKVFRHVNKFILEGIFFLNLQGSSGGNDCKFEHKKLIINSSFEALLNQFFTLL